MLRPGSSTYEAELESSRALARVRMLAPSLIVLAVTFAAVVAYLITDAQRQRRVEYAEYQYTVNNALDLWASGRLALAKQVLDPALDDVAIRDVVMMRDLTALGHLLDQRLDPLFSRGMATQLRLRDKNGHLLLTVYADGRIEPQSGAQPQWDDGLPSTGRALHLSSSGRARLTFTLPWALGEGDTAYFELIDDDAALLTQVAGRVGAKLFARPDRLVVGAGDAGVPPALLAAVRDERPRRQIVALMQTLISQGRAGITGVIDGKDVDIVDIAAQDGGLLAHNDLIAVRDVAARERAIRHSIATGLMLALALAFVIGLYAAHISTQMLDSLSNEEAARLREREERLRAVMDTVADGIATVSSHGNILSANHALEAIFGYDRGELLAKGIHELISDDLNDEQRTVMRHMREATTRSESRAEGEVVGRRKDGSTFPLELSLTCAVINGKPVATVVLRDVTEQKAAKDLLIAAVSEQKAIQQALRQRSDELVRAARQLSLARDKAEAANAAKSRFLATMSHELRTPMNGILGMVGLLLKSPLNDDQKAWADTIKESGDALLTLLNDILDLSKIEAGKLEVHPTLLDPVVLARHIATTWGPLAEAKGLTFHYDAPEEGRRVMGDAVRLRQILANLVNNAIKFTDQGEVRLKLVLTQDGEMYARLRYEISDTGVGIANDKLGLLFQKFSQVDGSHARRHGGSGLGLAICRELAVLMGGDVGVETVEGAGSIFWVDVPCEIAPGESWDNTRFAPSAPAVSDAPVARRVKILVAEDHPVNQSLFKALIDHLGHDLDVVSNGAEAVAALQKNAYDLVLLDAHMPVMNGVEAAEQIRRLDGPSARTPLVVVTADAMVGDRERYLAAGMDDYITKPVDLRELAAAILRHTAQNHGCAEPNTPGPRPSAYAGAAE